ncbi:2-oxoglutarate dehydrogenase complex dihydrolipoyllysine-residue succinyltransferase [Kaustia mangrovi]|uniref:Dihydrolipoyllysine-residue succinyltransferase component of 2-oxoglutarate dehydrogenase complex n=1 Tax=Kaustia mangrovi TaxID=2593653 RepID=A0A7S8C3A9_9HYPH|nr:2-oxoglutarate dehydrogenase complex dihydrolipoyllysine-residue succinyltransferase [Kaustia mangrovi]QPC42594.1 2-oxoglutarate dehydrogenase complex dihydrolipoyllysine-residue succinyltransferase [Kaustia mangrovi]
MATEIRVPSLGESVTEATIAQWFKKEGDAVQADEPLVELETDKVTVEVPAPAAGTLSEISAKDGDTVEVGALLGAIAEGAAAAASEAPAKEEKAKEPAPEKAPEPEAKAEEPEEAPAKAEPSGDQPLSPAVRKIVEEANVDPSRIEGSGKDGRILKGDVLAFLEKDEGGKAEAPAQAKAPRAPVAEDDASREERVRMTRLRKTIARRLKDAQDTAAMLTTFNEVDMTAVMALRSEYKDLFEKKHGVKLGFMSFFVKACVHALKEIPEVNAEIDGDDLVYKNYYHVGVAVGTEKGLVVPVVRDADALSLAEIEKTINDYAARARDGQLKLEEMQGGTFTISNGGVYGSLMSTPILNAPQSGILGMHKIQQRPMAVDGEIKLRPMMYLALSYDHRIVDGREAVTFLVRIKDTLEQPQRLMLDL